MKLQNHIFCFPNNVSILPSFFKVIIWNHLKHWKQMPMSLEDNQSKEKNDKKFLAFLDLQSTFGLFGIYPSFFFFLFLRMRFLWKRGDIFGLKSYTIYFFFLLQFLNRIKIKFDKELIFEKKIFTSIKLNIQ